MKWPFVRRSTHDAEIAGLRRENAALDNKVGRMWDALFWCGGSPSFGPGGDACEGWKKVVGPLLDECTESYIAYVSEAD